MSILIIAEHDNENLHPSTLNVVTAASALGTTLHVLVVGHDCAKVVDKASYIKGVSKVLVADAECYRDQLAEPTAALIYTLAKDYSHILCCSNSTGKNILPRAAALSDSQPISDVLAIESSDTFERPIYAGNIIARVKSKDTIKFISVRATQFDASIMGASQSEIEMLSYTGNFSQTCFVSEDISKSDRPDLSSAKIVVSGGRALKSAENFEMLQTMADKLGAAVGASRAAVDEGFVSNDLQVGQTGKIVAPDLYIACGISGAIQHLAGMKDSKIIVAINKDEDAPIFDIADYGLVGDLFEIIPAFNTLLSEQI